MREKHWRILQEAQIKAIPSNDFSLYDQTLDTAFLLNIIPTEVANLDLSPLEKYFALARGYQGAKGDVKARPMKKWFNTNYHYLVPKFEKNTQIKVPRKFMAILEKYEYQPESLKEAGLAYALDQIVDLVTQDADGIHLYTMNQAETARYIYQATTAIFQNLSHAS